MSRQLCDAAAGSWIHQNRGRNEEKTIFGGEKMHIGEMAEVQ